jgi:hypothetical protein
MNLFPSIKIPCAWLGAIWIVLWLMVAGCRLPTAHPPSGPAPVAEQLAHVTWPARVVECETLPDGRSIELLLRGADGSPMRVRFYYPVGEGARWGAYLDTLQPSGHGWVRLRPGSVDERATMEFLFRVLGEQFGIEKLRAVRAQASKGVPASALPLPDAEYSAWRLQYLVAMEVLPDVENRLRNPPPP